MSIASYELNAASLPDKVKDSLPTAEQIEQLLAEEPDESVDSGNVEIENFTEKHL